MLAHCPQFLYFRRKSGRLGPFCRVNPHPFERSLINGIDVLLPVRYCSLATQLPTHSQLNLYVNQDVRDAMATAVQHGLKPALRDKRLPALDGLRAISIALVLIGHLSGTRNFPSNHLERYLGDYANLGVIVFFVISGYLITNLLVVELRRFGRISLRLFYARRILRLFPAFMLLMLFLLVLSAMGWITVTSKDLLTAFTYTVNFRTHASWYIGHLWSLSVEEQFYLMWPALLAIAGRERSGKVAVGVILSSPIARLIAMRLHLPGAIFPCVADSLAAGCLLALYGDQLSAQGWYRRVSGFRYFLPLALAAVCVCSWARQYAIGITLGLTVINLLLALVVHHCVTVVSPVTKLLTARPAVAIGLLSYSLYLWQQIFLNRNSSWAVCSFPWNLAFAVAAASASYLCVERPLNQLRHKLRPGSATHT